MKDNHTSPRDMACIGLLFCVMSVMMFSLPLDVGLVFFAGLLGTGILAIWAACHEAKQG